MARAGRPNKGARDHFTTRPHQDVGKLIRQQAADGGWNLGEYIAAVLSEHVGRPELAPPPERPAKGEELRLTG